MEVKSSKLIIVDKPISDEKQLQDILPVCRFESSGSKVCLQLQQLRSPLVGIIFGYVMDEGMEGLSLDMDIEMLVKNDKIGFKQLGKIHNNQYIYRLLQLNSCDCYQKPITIVATLKYSSSKQYEPMHSINDLARKLAKRSFGLYNQKTFTLIKRQIIIKDPMDAVYRFSPLGYIWMKLTNRKNQLIIREVRLATWLSQNEELKQFNSKSSLEETIKLQSGQSLGVILSCPNSLRGQQLQYWIEFNLPQLSTHTFKMIKWIFIE